VDDEAFCRLLDHLGLSRRGYRKVRRGVKKRIVRHMQELGCRTLGGYLELLGENEEARKRCDRLLTVSISRFFRDRRLWQILEDRILPGLISSGKDPIRVWIAGCASGEEVYSLRILWERLAGSPSHPRLEITATDLNRDCLKRARQGAYPASSLKEAPEDVKAAWFEPNAKGSRYAVKPALKKGINWLERDLFAGPPGTGYDILFCRNNLLTYHTEPRIRPVLEALVRSLSPGGYLIVGSHERLPPGGFDLTPVPRVGCSYRRCRERAENENGGRLR
jgi:chemotaxis methyl-accepting protein methylase